MGAEEFLPGVEQTTLRFSLPVSPAVWTEGLSVLGKQSIMGAPVCPITFYLSQWLYHPVQKQAILAVAASSASHLLITTFYIKITYAI